MKYLLQLATIFALMVSPLFSQNSIRPDVRMFLDYARFRYDHTNTYLEIYYILHAGQTGEKNPETIDVRLALYLTDVNKDSVLASDNFEVDLQPNQTASGDMASGARGSLIKTVLPPGKYELKLLRVNNDGTQRLDSIKHVLTTAPFKGDKISLSDLELCSNIRTGATNKDELFYKNTMEVYPNPTHIYGVENPNLFYYIELYNVDKTPDLAQAAGISQPDKEDNSAGGLEANPSASSQIEIQVAIKDEEGNIYDQKVYHRSRDYESLVEKGRFSVSNLPDGLYTLIFAAVDPALEYSVYRLNNFYVVNPDRAVSSEVTAMSEFPQSIYFNMPEEVVDKRFAQATYITDQKSKKVYESLESVESKRMFMFNFWREKEKDKPGLQHEYYSRVEYANENYRQTGKEGWQTDRGRVYIVYGEPSETITRASSSRDEPFIIWIYHELQGGVRFLFVDEFGFDSYRLVSSNMRGEIYDPTWDEYLNILVER